MTRRFALGFEPVRGQSFELMMPSDVSQHVTLLGVTGAGKTTTAATLVQAALDDGLGVVVLDAKGGGLRVAAQQLATSAGVPYREVMPGSPLRGRVERGAWE